MLKLLPLATALVLAGCAIESTPERPNVILICLDTVRADRMGFLGYRRNPTTPRLDRLAAESVVFTDVGATAGWTKPSVPSFFTGTFPMQHGVYEGSARDVSGKVTDLLADEALTLAEVFSAHGYDTGAFIRNSQLKPGNGFEQGFDHYKERAGDAREIRWRATDWLDERGERPFFLYMHFLDAHWPFPVPEQYAHMFAGAQGVERFRGKDSHALRDAINDGELELTGAEIETLEAVYDGSIRFIDDELARFFAGLEKRDMWKDTIVCVVADHGEEFFEHGRVGHGHGLYENLVRVPWLLRIPGGEPRELSDAVSLVDLFPTLLAAARLEASSEVAGVNRLESSMATRPILAEHKGPGHYMQSLRAGRWKLVRTFRAKSDDRPAPERPSLGQRVEVEFEPVSPGRWRATEISALADPPDQAIEIKGTVAGLDDSGFVLNGFAIRPASDCELYGQVPNAMTAVDLPEGQPVKVVGSFAGSEFVCQRIKLYAQGKPTDREIRGPILALESDRLRIGPQWIDWDSQTKLDLGSSQSRERMTREDVFRIIEWGGTAAAEAGFPVQTTLYDLTSDAGEVVATVDAEVERRLSLQLDELARELSLQRVLAERAVLDEAALEELRKIGYAR